VSHYNQVHLIDHEHLSIIQSIRSPRQQQQQQQPDEDGPHHAHPGNNIKIIIMKIVHKNRIQESCAIAKVTAQCALYIGALKLFGTP